MSVVLIASGAVNGAAAARDASRQAGEPGTDAAGQRTFAGRVVGPDGEAVAGLEILLHRVTNAGGTQLARSMTADDGRFTMRYEPPADGEGVYFVATRYNGRVFIGPMLRAPFTDPTDYQVQVGVAGVGDVQALMQRSPSAPPSGSGVAAPSPVPGAAFVAVMLSAAIAIGVVLVVRGAGPSARRRALVGLAELDEAGANGGSPRDVARRRRELLRHVTGA